MRRGGFSGTCCWHYCGKVEGLKVYRHSNDKEWASAQGRQNANRRRLPGNHRLRSRYTVACVQGAAIMQLVKQIWSRGRTGKVAIGCGSLMLLCSMCTLISMIWAATPQGRQATERRNATATASAFIKLETANAPTVTAPPTKTPAPTNTPRASNTPRPTVTAKVETPQAAGVVGVTGRLCRQRLR